MNPETRDLLEYLREQRVEPFKVAGRIDARRHLARVFPAELPLLVSHQSYPSYRQMMGEGWLHWQDYYELWVAAGGHGEYRCGAHRFAFSPGDVVLVDPLKLHGVLRMEKTHSPLVFFFRAEAVAPTGAALDRALLAAWDRRPEKSLPRLKADTAAAGPVHGAMLRLAGDIHQPLHCATRCTENRPEGDRGGNDFLIAGADNLHSYWDSGGKFFPANFERPLNQAGVDKVKALAAQCVAGNPRGAFAAQLAVRDFQAWADEGYALAVSHAYGDIEPGEPPSAVYATRAQNLSKKQVALAGYRLAELLNGIFK